MRVLRTPNQGYLADHDMLALWSGAGPVSTTAATNWGTTLGKAGKERNLIPRPLGKTIDQGKHLFRPNDSTAYRFDGTVCLATDGDTLGDSAYCSNPSLGFSFATFYSLTSGATQTIIERSVENGTLASNKLQWQLTWLGTQSRFLFRGISTGNVNMEVLSDVVPASGFIGLEVAEARQVRFYSSAQQGGQIGSTATLSANLKTSVTSGSTRWIIGGSLADVTGGSFSSAPTATITSGALCEMALWARPVGETRMRSAYGGCVQPWDDGVLLESENYVAKVRVLIEGVDGLLQNLSDIDGQDWVRECTREVDVDDGFVKANITLQRRKGQLADISPITTSTAEFSHFLSLRRKVRMERALVPSLWNIQGWEWKTIFEGYIDEWSVGRDSVSLKCSDQGAVLTDAFIMENRAYNYPVVKSMEDVQQEIIDDFEPTLRTASFPEVIGYKGFAPNKPPLVYTEAGTAATPTGGGSALAIRYNDVSSGPVMSALSALTDQIGYATEFKYHEPWDDYRLTSYSPRRTRTIPHQSIREVGGTEMRIEFKEPHGLSMGQPVRPFGTSISDFDVPCSVSSVIDYYRVMALPVTGSAITPGSASGTTGSVSFTYNYTLSDSAIDSATDAGSSIGNIRNHAVVRINRNDSTATTALVEADVSLGQLQVRTVRSLAHIDPTGNGISFTLVGGTSTATALNGTYTGYVNPSGGGRTIIADVPTPAPAGTYSTNLPMLTTQNEIYQEVVSTSTPSLQKYGYLPVAVYEGSNLAINTVAEAQRLADNLISDLSSPTIDMVLTTNIKPFELHDVLSIPTDRNGRWAVPLTAAVVGISEKYSSGDCVAQYKTRSDTPSRGFAWADRIAIRPGAGAPASNNLSNVLEQAADWRLSDAAKSARRFRFARAKQAVRRETGLRYDRTEVWLSPASGFAPTEATRAGSFRGDRFEISSLANGEMLSPGTRYYVRFGDRDIYGNVSQITGVGSASTATVPSFVARFLDETAGAAAANVTGATYRMVPSTYTPMTGLTVDDGTDGGALTYDTFNNYTTASLTFTAPCDGTFSCRHQSAWFGDPLKCVATTNWTVLGGWLQMRGATTLGFHGESILQGVGATVSYILTAAVDVSCSSGDRLIFMRRNASTPSTVDVCFSGGSTASTNYGLTSYAVINQR
jgi:hypothetical protein